jgi:hypothetical protein
LENFEGFNQFAVVAFAFFTDVFDESHYLTDGVDGGEQCAGDVCVDEELFVTQFTQ